jgi:hypothetical protein
MLTSGKGLIRLDYFLCGILDLRVEIFGSASRLKATTELR